MATIKDYVTCRKSGKADQAEKIKKELLLSRPSMAIDLAALGKAEYDAGEVEKSLELYDIALEFVPPENKELVMFSADILNSKGASLRKLGQPEAALKCYTEATRINPNLIAALYNTAILYYMRNEFQLCLEAYHKILSIDPDDTDVLNNMAVVYSDIKQYHNALACYELVIHLKPEHPFAYLNKSLLLLALGQFEEGWKIYESRWDRDATAVKNSVKFDKPVWLGKEDLTGKCLLIHSEQGLGDTIQFCRYANTLSKQGVKILLQVQESLKVLFRDSLDPWIEIYGENDKIPEEYDFHIPIMSLPLALKTTENTIPNEVPYLWAIDATKLTKWRTIIGQSKKIKIGLVLSGSTINYTDSHTYKRRWINLDNLAPVLELDYEFHVIQKDLSPLAFNTLDKYPQVKTYCDEISDFSDTAALIEEMDLIISIDTSVAHLAGAMGKKVWILLPYSADFRWMIDRGDTPWYPTAILFREPTVNSWDIVGKDIAKELVNVFH